MMNMHAIRQTGLVFTLFAGIFAATGTIAGASKSRDTITVFAAASLTEAFSEMARAFESENPEKHIQLNFAGSHTLRSQIEYGAPADVYASANRKHMQALIAQGLTENSNSLIFARNRMALVTPTDNPAELQDPCDLAKPGIKIILADKDVPAGSYARKILQKLETICGARYRERVMKNVVSNEDTVKKVVAKIGLGEADAGLVFISDTAASSRLHVIAIPAEYNVVGEYPIAAIKQSRNPVLAKAFIDFVMSADGQAILNRWGFITINNP